MAGCLTKILTFFGIIFVVIYLIMDVIFTGISQVDTIGNFDFKLYKNNIFGYNSRHYMVPLASYNVYDTRYKLTELESKDAQGSIEYNQVIMYRGIMDNQYTKYTAISYSSNNKIHHGYLITPKDKPPRLQRILKYDQSIASGEYVKYFYEASNNLYDTFKKDIHNLYTVSVNDTQSQTLLDKGYEEFEYIKEAADIITEIVDYNQPNCMFESENCVTLKKNDFKIKVDGDKVFCDKISCEKIKTIFENTFSDDNLKKYYLTLKIPQI
jgi:hypothetical protein